ncbi:uncharacterized protein LDX57_006305 [Aspergillus melleus]|uniref:uncharacterized protein n=1 Tax=Aspergillus melleus TaxID=138277 RepID=UPI001E8EA3EB|nr:uncharacterized protein LDX57_006305 [Aspergillus melleus]KAH8428609.1 hypothetical protein LDX57_006305 [Aspergillus melleus]
MRSSWILAAAAFPFVVAGLTVDETDDGIVVDTESEGGFKVTIDSSGSITSLVYGGEEYQYASTGSHIASGLGSGTTVNHTTEGNYAVVSAKADSDDFNLTHYYVFEDGKSVIYMGTYTVDQPSVGELRYIARLVNIPKAYKEGEVSDTTGGDTVEGSDVFLVDGETRSKFYSSQRFIDDSGYCAYTEDSSVHACFLSDTRSREKSSGGPFFRDIDLNNGGDYHSVTFYMNSGHVQTEDFRTGFFGPYILSFSGSDIPSWDDFDVSFFEDLDLEGYVGSSGRGVVSGKASGTSDKFPAIVHLYNDEYQSWANASSGTFTTPEVVEGEYTLALYQGELLAATTTVSVKAGETASASISATNDIITQERTTVWQIGEYDGTPQGFLNADKQLRMHPSDDRMGAWKASAFVVDDSETSDFPMAIFADVNNGQEVQFSLSESIESDVIVRIATTLAFQSGRPQLTLNEASCDAPDAPAKIDSRGVTRGAYRGFGEVYNCTFAADDLVQGDNTLKISVVSGSGGEGFLSANYVIDAVELYYV